MTEPTYVYGYGRTKHIAGADGKSLCGAEGGYPREEPKRPTCKRCESLRASAAIAKVKEGDA